MRTRISPATARVLAVGALLGLLMASGGPFTIAQAQSQPATFADRLEYSRAVEVAMWARPFMGVKALMDGLQRDAGVGYNDIGYFSKLRNSKFNEAEVAVKWNVQRGCSASHLRTLGCLWAA
jgi:hypothetical protein